MKKLISAFFLISIFIGSCNKVNTNINNQNLIGKSKKSRSNGNVIFINGTPIPYYNSQADFRQKYEQLEAIYTESLRSTYNAYNNSACLRSGFQTTQVV